MFNSNPNIWRYNQPQTQSQAPILIDDSESDENDEEIPHPGMPAYNSRTHHGPRPPAYTTSLPIEQEKKIRSRLREERHAALCVLMDRELLTIQALAAQETLPQTRRRFLSTLLSPSDPSTAASIRADQFTIQRSSSASASLSSANVEPMVVSRGVVDVCESDDSGWYKPDPDAALGVSASSASPASSAKMKGRGTGMATPERSRAKGRASSGRHQQQQQPPPRERRRRWSGAERRDFGPGVSF
ncbi:hypothetical protein BJX76DRAFT_341339 [Aspergillus varians]